MPETTTPAGAIPVAAGAIPAQSNPAPDAGQQPATGATDQDAEDLKALGDPGKRALDLMKAARKAAEDRAKAAESELETLRTANLSESEKRDKRLSDLEREQADWSRERQDLLLRSAVQQQALRLGFTHPELALGVLDRSAIQFEASGEPKNLETLLTDLTKAYPELVGAVRPSGSADGGPRGSTAAGRVYKASELNDRAFYEKNRADINQAYRENRILADQ